MRKTMSKVFISTIGCLKNEEDSERMAGLLAGAGHEIVFSPEEAEIIAVNTCAFIEDAQRESIDEILAMAEYKELGKKLVVTGCLPQLYADELAIEIPEVDAFLGVDEYGSVAEVFAGVGGDDNGAVYDGKASREPGVLIGERFALSSRHSATLKIAEGCNNRCTYCIIPKIRGPYRSVPMEALVSETEKLAGEGCKELVLIAQDTSLYGADLYGKLMLPELMRALCEVDGIEWIRLLYCYDERVTDELIEVMASEPKILHYIDMPIQHVSRSVLSDMGRASSPEHIRGTVSRLRRAMPDVTIRSSLIVGFPAETSEDFAELADFVEEGNIDRVGVFEFSPVAGAPASCMQGQVPEEIAKERRFQLMEIARERSLATNEALIGSTLDVIIDEYEGEDTDGDIWIGRTRADAPEVDGEVMVRALKGAHPGDLRGRIVRVLIEDAFDYDLVGVLVEDE
jgi:ribosomal protein S12 methylthiotransferase